MQRFPGKYPTESTNFSIESCMYRTFFFKWLQQLKAFCVTYILLDFSNIRTFVVYGKEASPYSRRLRILFDTLIQR